MRDGNALLSLLGGLATLLVRCKSTNELHIAINLEALPITTPEGLFYSHGHLLIRLGLCIGKLLIVLSEPFASCVRDSDLSWGYFRS